MSISWALSFYTNLTLQRVKTAFWFPTVSKKFLNSSWEMTWTSWWTILLHLPMVTRGCDLYCGCCLPSARVPGVSMLRTSMTNHRSSHSIHPNLPNATAVRRSHHRWPWRQSLCDSVDRPLSGTVQLTPGTADYSSENKVVVRETPPVTCFKLKTYCQNMVKRRQ